MGAVLPPWPHAAAATEIRVRICEKETIKATPKPGRSVRIHGNLILSHGTRRVGPRSSSVDVTHQVAVELDHRDENVHPAAFTCLQNCKNLIHDMLAKAPATREYDLAAAGNWVDSTWTPLDIATALLRKVWDEYEGALDGLEFDVHLPELRVTLAYSEPKALLLACKESSAETEAAGALARCRKRRREAAGELCPICLLDMETEDEETVRLPCSHSFHCQCIETWFQTTSTCPTCRLDIMERFSFVRAAPPKINYDLVRITLFDGESEEVVHHLDGLWSLFGDESEDEPDIAEGEQSGSEIRMFSDEYRDEALLDSLTEGEQSIASQLQLSHDESGDLTPLDDVAEDEQCIASDIQLFDDQSEDEHFLDDVAEGEQSIELFARESEGALFSNDVVKGEQSIASEFQLSIDESDVEIFLVDVAKGEQFITSELQLPGDKSEDQAPLDDVAQAEEPIASVQLFGSLSRDKAFLDDIAKGEQLYLPKYNCLVTNLKMNRS